MMGKLARMWFDGILHWKVPKAVQTEQLVGLAVIGITVALVLPSASHWPLWAQISAGAVLVLLVGLINGGCRALAKR